MLMLHLVVASVLCTVLAGDSVGGATREMSGPNLFGRPPMLMVGDSDEGVVFGDATDIALGVGGRVYILDGGFSKVHMLSADGDYRGSFGTVGEGPSEFTLPLCITTDRKTGDVWVGNLGGRLSHFSDDGEPIDDIRFSWPGPRPVRSIHFDESGNIYVACANVMGQTMIHVFGLDHSLVRSFGDTFAVGSPETDTYDEFSYAVGFLDVRGGVIYYTQKNPYEIRLYSLRGELLDSIGDSGQGVPYPPPVRQANGTRVQRSLMGSWGIVALAGGGWLNNIVVPVSADFPVGGSITEIYDEEGIIVRQESHRSPVFVRVQDSDGHLWAVDNEPYARVMKYPMIE